MGTPRPQGRLGTPRGPPKHVRNLQPLSFLAKIVLLFLVCVQIAPRLYATHFKEQKERNIVIERDLMTINFKCYFSGDLNLVSTIDFKKPLPIAGKYIEYSYSCYSFQNTSEIFLSLELEPIRPELINNSNVFCAVANRSLFQSLCLHHQCLRSLAFANYTECSQNLNALMRGRRRLWTPCSELYSRWFSTLSHPPILPPPLSSRSGKSGDT